MWLELLPNLPCLAALVEAFLQEACQDPQEANRASGQNQIVVAQAVPENRTLVEQTLGEQHKWVQPHKTLSVLQGLHA